MIKKDELHNYIREITRFIITKKLDLSAIKTIKQQPYYHMPATITDAILQAGLNYKRIVRPRALRLLTEYSDYKTTCDFLILMQVIPLQELINWKHPIKIDRIKKLTWFLYNNGIETERDLAKWLKIKNNCEKLKELNGIGNKTIDYLKILSGTESLAIDRHLFKFLELVGIPKYSYEETKLIYEKTAKSLNITAYELDKLIWSYFAKE